LLVSDFTSSYDAFTQKTCDCETHNVTMFFLVYSLKKIILKNTTLESSSHFEDNVLYYQLTS